MYGPVQSAGIDHVFPTASSYGDRSAPLLARCAFPMSAVRTPAAVARVESAAAIASADGSTPFVHTPCPRGWSPVRIVHRDG
jgi:hypothetical protein